MMERELLVVFAVYPIVAGIWLVVDRGGNSTVRPFTGISCFSLIGLMIFVVLQSEGLATGRHDAALRRIDKNLE